MGLLGTMSAIGTALGPSLGGVLIAALGWQAIFLVNVPLGIAAFWLALKTLPADRRGTQASAAGFDGLGTLLLALTLGAYALAMTTGGGTSACSMWRCCWPPHWPSGCSCWRRRRSPRR